VEQGLSDSTDEILPADIDPEPATAPAARRPWLPMALRVLLTLVVLAALGHYVAGLWASEQRQGLTIRWPWAIASVVLYSLGMCQGAAFWRACMADMGLAVPWHRAMAAYWLSQVAKYVPGKAWVVVVRCSAITREGRDLTPAAAATFYETLLVMGVGSAVSLICFAIAGGEGSGVLVAASAGCVLLFAGVLVPAVFRRLMRTMLLPFPQARGQEVLHCSGRTIAWGVVRGIVLWVLLGMSTLACVNATAPDVAPAGLLLPLTGGMALATVGGFVVIFMPGGLGVREGLLIAAATPVIGRAPAGVAALVVRLLWVFAEAATALGMLAWQKVVEHRRGRAGASASSSLH